MTRKKATASKAANRFAQELINKEPDLVSSLNRIRDRFQHSGNIGSGLEASFRELLGQILPRRFEIGHGEVIDSYGNHAGSTSSDGQIDVIVLGGDQFQLQSVSDPGLYIIEDCYMLGEVKTRLTREELNLTLKKGAAIKSLKPRPLNKGNMLFSNESGLENFFNKRGFFLFCYDSDLSISTVQEALIKYRYDNGSLPLDAVFMLNRGYIVNSHDGKGFLTMRDPDNQSIVGVSQSKNPALTGLAIWLNCTIPREIALSTYIPYYLLSPEMVNS